MTKPIELSKPTYEQLIIWCIAAPILTTWAMMSFLPIATIIGDWGDVGQVFIAIGFLATGALGFVAYRLMFRNNKTVPLGTVGSRTIKIVLLTTYALVWMLLYTI